MQIVQRADGHQQPARRGRGAQQPDRPPPGVPPTRRPFSLSDPHRQISDFLFVSNWSFIRVHEIADNRSNKRLASDEDVLAKLRSAQKP